MPRGKPITVNVKENEEYFKNYYHNTKADYTCQCGALINNHSLRKHLLTQKHIRIIELLNQIQSQKD